MAPGRTVTLLSTLQSSPMMTPIFIDGLSPLILTSVGPPRAVKRPLITHPLSITESLIKQPGPSVTSSPITLFLTWVNEEIDTLSPILVDGITQACGPISHPLPITAGPQPQ